MHNILFELDRLKITLENKGLSEAHIDQIIEKASQEINSAFSQQAEGAMLQAMDEGVAKRSPDFINELRMDLVNMQLTTESGNMNFSEAPFPMLPKLLKNAKPMKDGSGVYKVIPVGQPGKNRPKVSNNIYDAWKKINAERIETAKAKEAAIAPKGSKVEYRTATSKQNINTQWVMPAKEKDFTGTMQAVNKELSSSMDDIVRNIVRSYEESFG
jgi:hypothetical protein